MNRGHRVIVYFFLIPSFLGVSVFLLIPYLDVFRRSFLSAGGDFKGIANYIEVFENEAFRLAITNTFLFMAACIPLLMLLSLTIAIFIYENPKAGNFLRTGFLIPMAIPVASAVLVWRFLFDYQGIINGIIDAMGGQPRSWMESETAFLILVGSYIWKNLGYNIILWLAALSALNPSALEAAKLDGAGPLRRHWYITLPQLKIPAFVISVLAILNSFKVFREAYLVAGDYPHDSIYLIQHLFNNWFRNLEIDKIAAASVINSIILIVLILFLQRKWGRGETE